MGVGLVGSGWVMLCWPGKWHWVEGVVSCAYVFCIWRRCDVVTRQGVDVCAQSPPRPCPLRPRSARPPFPLAPTPFSTSTQPSSPCLFCALPDPSPPWCPCQAPTRAPSPWPPPAAPAAASCASPRSRPPAWPAGRPSRRRRAAPRCAATAPTRRGRSTTAPSTTSTPWSATLVRPQCGKGGGQGEGGAGGRLEWGAGALLAAPPSPPTNTL
jgi:hypothetical protein